MRKSRRDDLVGTLVGTPSSSWTASLSRKGVGELEAGPGARSSLPLIGTKGKRQNTPETRTSSSSAAARHTAARNFSSGLSPEQKTPTATRRAPLMIRQANPYSTPLCCSTSSTNRRLCDVRMERMAKSPKSVAGAGQRALRLVAMVSESTEKRQGSTMPRRASTASAQKAPPWNGESEGWLADSAHAQSLLSAGKFVEAYFAISAALTKHEAREDWQAALRACRAECSYALMNYKECTSDCHSALAAVDRLIRQGPARTDEGLEGRDHPPPFNMLHTAKLCARAHVMREEYDAAQAMYDYLLGSASCGSVAAGAMPPPPTAVERTLLLRERESLAAVKRFRQCASQGKWDGALAALTDARVLVEDTPLRVLEAFALFETGAVDAARESLLPYLPTIVPPEHEGGLHAEAAAKSGGPTTSERILLRCNVDAHYLLATALLAKISAYSGRPYMNIAAVLLQRCLRLNAAYAPALVLGEYLTKVEDAFALADDHCAKTGDRARAIRELSEAVALDPANKRVVASLLLRRAEVHLSAGRPLVAMDDCNASIQHDPSVARAFLLRAQVRQEIHCEAEAAADMAMVRRLNPNLAEGTVPKRSSTPHPPSFPSSASSTRPSSRRPPKNEGKGRLPARPLPGAATSSASSLPPAKATAAPSLYQLLGVSQNASLGQIRQNFKRLTLQFHPDRLVNEPEEAQLHAAEVFKKINNAHAVLTDEERRRAYDATLLLSLS